MARSWLFAVLLPQLNQSVHDAEVLAVSTILHDLGLQELLMGLCDLKWRERMPREHSRRNEGIDDLLSQLIWDGVALNSTPSIALYKETEVALCTAGIGLDWGGWGYDKLTEAQVARIVDAFPRLQMSNDSPAAVCCIVETRPATTYDNFARDFGERFVPGYNRTSTVDYLLNSPLKE